MRLLSAISLNMLPQVDVAYLRIQAIEACDAAEMVRSYRTIDNCIGHPSTAAVVAAEMATRGVELPSAERRTVVLDVGEEVLVAQYIGPRLPEGATTLPEGAELKWFAVELPEQPPRVSEDERLALLREIKTLKLQVSHLEDRSRPVGDDGGGFFSDGDGLH